MTDFNWVDLLELVKDSTTCEMIFDETIILVDTFGIILYNPSIVLRKEEVGGGIITFNNGT